MQDGAERLAPKMALGLGGALQEGKGGSAFYLLFFSFIPAVCSHSPPLADTDSAFGFSLSSPFCSAIIIFQNSTASNLPGIADNQICLKCI